MIWILTLLLAAQEQPSPDHFEIAAFSGDAERSYLVGGLAYTLKLKAVDAKGNAIAGFKGPATIQGLSRLEDRRLAPLSTTPPFENGEVTLENVVRTGPVTVGFGRAATAWEPRVIPGWLSIVPPLLAVALAILTRQVLVSLLAGIWLGVFFVYDYNPFAGLLRTFDTHLIDSLHDRGHISIVLFTLALGGLVGVIGRSGGTKALVEAISRRARTRRGGLVSTWLMGIVVFFDDYANCLLVGSAARPFTDSKRISREKLSFVVDSTAAPVATLAFISTWVGFQVGQIAGTKVVPAGEAYTVFLQTIPYSFYCVLMLYFVLLLCVTERDFGPMLAAERRAVETGEVLRPGAAPLMDRELTDMKVPEDRKLHWRNAAIPIGSVILFVLLGLYLDGKLRGVPGKRGEIETAVREGSKTPETAKADLAELETLRATIATADSYAVLTWASFGGSLVALLLVLFSGTLKLGEALDAWVTGCKSMVLAVLILVLAWTLGEICKKHLETGSWVISLVSPPPHFLPLIVFLASCVISFATGTSYGTMAIVFPIAAPMAWALTGDASGFSAGTVDSIRMATLGAVLTGAVFGDHCSPISDTTVISSMASAADHLDHVKTQMPYALLCAAVAAVAGFIPAGFGFPAWASLLLGAGLLAAAVFLFGKRVAAPAAG